MELLKRYEVPIAGFCDRVQVPPATVRTVAIVPNEASAARRAARVVR